MLSSSEELLCCRAVGVGVVYDLCIGGIERRKLKIWSVQYKVNACFDDYGSRNGAQRSKWCSRGSVAVGGIVRPKNIWGRRQNPRLKRSQTSLHIESIQIPNLLSISYFTSNRCVASKCAALEYTKKSLKPPATPRLRYTTLMHNSKHPDLVIRSWPPEILRRGV